MRGVAHHMYAVFGAASTSSMHTTVPNMVARRLGRDTLAAAGGGAFHAGNTHGPRGSLRSRSLGW